MQQLVESAVACDAFLKALAGGIVKHEKAALQLHVRAAPAHTPAGACQAALTPWLPQLSCLHAQRARSYCWNCGPG